MGEVRRLPLGRALFVDERDVGLRATWHLEQGIVNLSVWRGASCVETFHLPVSEVAKLVGFLVDGLAVATTSLVEEAVSEVEGGAGS